ncbi:MAG: hypothetical protein HOM11_00665 [Methylococcales bacterium]|jgi:hypothetical protein|nr:hypothetical protein [Methylococcales bacterium]MBT7444449.1 hypothetical protein [Methylococcales bacterium]
MSKADKRTEVLGEILFEYPANVYAGIPMRVSKRLPLADNRHVNLMTGLENGYPVAIYFKPIDYNLF